MAYKSFNADIQENELMFSRMNCSVWWEKGLQQTD